MNGNRPAAGADGAEKAAELRLRLKRLIVEELNLRGRDPETIEDDAVLFGPALGLDSLDALQLAVAVEEQLGVRLPDGDEARSVFRSVRTIADYVLEAKGA
jgi:acyl carrier protein